MFDVDVEKVAKAMLYMVDKAQSAATANEAATYSNAAEILSRVFVNLVTNTD